MPGGLNAVPHWLTLQACPAAGRQDATVLGSCGGAPGGCGADVEHGGLRGRHCQGTEQH
jgi:hypothetical protein